MEHCKIKKITKLPFEQLRFEKLTYATVPEFRVHSSGIEQELMCRYAE